MAAVASEGGGDVSTSSAFPTLRSYTQELAPRTLLDLKLVAMAGAIKDKKNWFQKLQDPEIMHKWEEEARLQGATPEEMNFVFAELKYLASQFQGPLAPAAVPGVYAADDYIPQDLHEELVAYVAKLEAEKEPDWHPGSNDQVRDLVHPSLYQLVYGVSKSLAADAPPLTVDNCLQAMGTGEVVTHSLPDESHPEHYGRKMTSRKHQWLPAVVHVSDEGRAEFVSYINNLHPRKHEALYPILARIFEKFLPMFEAVLNEELNPQPYPVKVDPYGWYDETGKPPYTDPNYDEWERNRALIPPKVPEFVPPPPPTKTVTLKGRNLQVIVKLASVHLTPEKPAYGGGSWHVEGMRNDGIVATGIYYYQHSNITDSRLAFRVAVEDPSYEQGDHRGVELMYGLEDDDHMSQRLGAVTTNGGRCVCFFNTMQHQVQPFELVDKTRPGERKFVLFWLVDPGNPVQYSTANVPPQQLEWMSDEIFSNDGGPTRLSMLASDAQAMVSKHMEDRLSCPYSWKRALEYREDLMAERKYDIDNEQNEQYFEREFYLCEH